MMERAFVSHAVLLSLSVLLNVVSASANASSSEVTAQREFDYFALALQWPGTFCQRTRHCCSSNGCCRSSQLTEFTIHGLWPDYNDGSYPSCCSSSDFDIKKISSLMPVLQEYWPSLSCGSPSVCHGGKGLFWAHEWEKHGTCSYPVIKDEYSYFSKALDLYSMYNITRILSTEGIFASNSVKYPVRDIISAIEKATGALPLLECRGSFLEELQLCFDKAFKQLGGGASVAFGDVEVVVGDEVLNCPLVVVFVCWLWLQGESGINIAEAVIRLCEQEQVVLAIVEGEEP